MGVLSTFDDGLTLAGETWQGILALEQALVCARWVVANDGEAASALESFTRSDDFDQAWAKARAVRNHVLVHFDGWVARDPTAMVVVDSSGVHASNGFAFGFSEWQKWLDILEPWAMGRLALPMRPSHRQAVVPPSVTIPRPPDPQTATHPSVGSVWFGRDFDQETLLLRDRSDELPAGEPVACVGRLASSGRRQAIRILVSKPDGSVVYAGEPQVIAEGSDVAAVVVRGISIPGPYVMSFTTDDGEALAEGLVTVI